MPEQPTQQPSQEERFRAAMQRILAVSKPEILKREAEDKERRTAAREAQDEG